MNSTNAFFVSLCEHSSKKIMSSGIVKIKVREVFFKSGKESNNFIFIEKLT